MNTHRICGAAVMLCLTLCASAARPDDKPADNAKARMEAARKVYEGMIARSKGIEVGYQLDQERLNLWSRRWMEAQRDLAANAKERIAAVQAHLDRMKQWEEQVRKMQKSPQATPLDLVAQEFYRLEAEHWLAEEKAK